MSTSEHDPSGPRRRIGVPRPQRPRVPSDARTIGEESVPTLFDMPPAPPVSEPEPPTIVEPKPQEDLEPPRRPKPPKKRPSGFQTTLRQVMKLVVTVIKLVLNAPVWVVSTIVRLISRPKWTHFGLYRTPARRGWRRWMYDWSECRWNFGASLRIRRHLARKTSTRRRPKKGVVVAVLSPAGGQGKTTNAVKIAQELHKEWPGVPILLVDTNPSPGTLDPRVGLMPTSQHRRSGDQSWRRIQAIDDGYPEEACWSLEDVHAHLKDLTDFPQVNWRFPYVREQGLYVLGGYQPTDLEEGRFKGVNFEETMDLLRERFAFIVLDYGTDPWHHVGQSILKTVDAYVVPTMRSADRLKQTADLIAKLQGHYRSDEKMTIRYKAIDKLVVVINKVPFDWGGRRTDRAMEAIQEILTSSEHALRDGQPLERFSGPVLHMPWTRGLSGGRVIRPNSDGPWARTASAEIAAAALNIAFKAREDELRLEQEKSESQLELVFEEPLSANNPNPE